MRRIAVAAIFIAVLGFVGLLQRPRIDLSRPVPALKHTSEVSSAKPSPATHASEASGISEWTNEDSADASADATAGRAANRLRGAHLEADLVAAYLQEADPAVRAQLAGEFLNVDREAALRRLIELLKSEADPDAREALIATLCEIADGGVSVNFADALGDLYKANDDLLARRQYQDLIARQPTAPNAAFLRGIYEDQQADPQERLDAGENLMRMLTQRHSLLDAGDTARLNDWLRLQAQAFADDPEMRSQAVMALAERRHENGSFFAEMLQSETDAGVRRLLQRFVPMGENTNQSF